METERTKEKSRRVKKKNAETNKTHVNDEACMLTEITALIAENERLKGLLGKASKAMYCCTIIGFGKEYDPASEFCKGALYAIEAVNSSIWETLGAPDGKRSYMWWERQINPDAKFVDGEGNEIQYPTRDTLKIGDIDK